MKRREKRELKCGEETEAKRARQKRSKVKKGCSGWLEPGGGSWGRGCRVKGWWGVRGQVEKADTETEEFKNSRTSQRSLLVVQRSILSAWGITRAAMNCGVEKVDDGMNARRSARHSPHVSLFRKKFLLLRHFADMPLAFDFDSY